MEHTLFAGRYRLEERLGGGGMADVWAAEDVELGRPVALKRIAPQADPERFRREARAVAALSHPNIMRLFDYGEADGRPYMVLERLSGGNLEDRLHNGRLPDDETERIARDIAEGLAVAHANGLVHRDLKPANILFDDEDRAKIADFGIARMSDDGTLTEAGAVIGTATTISPEQAGGGTATAASDVYSFGALLFWMLTGRPPFDSDQPFELLRLHRTTAPPSVDELRPQPPPVLAALASDSMAKDPAQRPADGAALLRRLEPETAAATIPLAAVPPSRPRRRVPFGLLAGLALAAFAAGGVAVAVLLVRGGPAVPARGHTSVTVPTAASTPPSTAPSAVPPTTGVSSAETQPTTATQPRTTTLRATTGTVATTAPVPPTTTDFGTTTGDTTTTDVGTTTVASTPLQGTTTVGSGP